MDETDSGLDIDALKTVAEGATSLRDAETAPSSSSRTTSGCCNTSCPTTSTSCSTAASSRPADKELALELDDARVTTGSKKKWRLTPDRDSRRAQAPRS